MVESGIRQPDTEVIWMERLQYERAKSPRRLPTLGEVDLEERDVQLRTMGRLSSSYGRSKVQFIEVSNITIYYSIYS